MVVLWVWFCFLPPVCFCAVPPFSFVCRDVVFFSLRIESLLAASGSVIWFFRLLVGRACSFFSAAHLVMASLSHEVCSFSPSALWVRNIVLWPPPMCQARPRNFAVHGKTLVGEYPCDLLLWPPPESVRFENSRPFLHIWKKCFQLNFGEKAPLSLSLFFLWGDCPRVSQKRTPSKVSFWAFLSIMLPKNLSSFSRTIVFLFTAPRASKPSPLSSRLKFRRDFLSAPFLLEKGNSPCFSKAPLSNFKEPYIPPKFCAFFRPFFPAFTKRPTFPIGCFWNPVSLFGQLPSLPLAQTSN